MSTFPIAVVACMDDDIQMDPKALWVGTPGSYVTLEGTSEKYPTEVRRLVEKYRPLINTVLKELTTEMEIPSFVVTSHEGCGAMGIQGVTDSKEVAEKTQQFITSNSDMPKYLGHISSDPVNTLHDEASQSDVATHITRTQESHEHHACGIVFTTGGFISGEEMEMLKENKLVDIVVHQEASENIVTEPVLKKYFVVCADPMNRVITQQGGKKEDVITILKFIKDLAETIMHGTLQHMHHGQQVDRPKLRVVSYNAGRLSKDAIANEQIVQAVMA